jgi:hypothetical protein
MKNLSWLILGITTLLCAFGGSQVVMKLNGEAHAAGTITPALAILGLITAGLGAKGYFQARSSKTPTPLLSSLSLVIGALALLMALYFLLP